MKYILYAIAEKGEGRVMKVGEYDEVEDIEIIVSMFDRDVILSIETKKDEED